MKPLQRGEFVVVTASGRTVRAMVTLASANGRSIVLMFDAMLGGFVGVMPVSLDDDDGTGAATGAALDGMPVTITRERCADYRPDHNGECLNCDEPAFMHERSEDEP